MPIRKELKIYYGPAHRAYREKLIEIFGAVCMECGRETPEYLNLSHTNHDPRRADLVKLRCPSCHARHDSRQRYAQTRRTWARRRGQLWLLPEIEFAPYAPWMVPTRVLKDAQERLF